MATDPTGSILNKRYWIGEKIAESSVNTVFQAIDMAGAIPVALKLLPRERCRPEHLLRLHMEAETLSRLNHPHIVRILSTGIPTPPLSGFSYGLATEHVDGTTRQDCAHAGRRLSTLEGYGYSPAVNQQHEKRRCHYGSNHR